ncbi:hypothetical protein ACFQ51_42805 [Streptomyces kaempferi]
MSLTERIHSDHDLVKHLGDWTEASRFEVKARRGSAVLDLRSPGLPDDVEIHLDMDRAMVKLLVDDGTAVDHWNLRWTARGRIKDSRSPSAATRRPAALSVCPALRRTARSASTAAASRSCRRCSLARTSRICASRTRAAAYRRSTTLRGAPVMTRIGKARTALVIGGGIAARSPRWRSARQVSRPPSTRRTTTRPTGSEAA